MTAPEILTVAEVLQRYRLKDRRAARRLMDAAGSFRMGAGLFVRLDDLLALEDRQRAERGSARPPAPPSATSRASSQQAPGGLTVATQPGWWRDPPGGTLAPLNRKERPA